MTPRVSTAVFALALGSLVFGSIVGCRSTPPRTDCSSSRDCSAMRQVCALERGYCVPCVADPDCLSETRACVAYQCVDVTPCTSTVMCHGGLCDTGRGRCVDCMTVDDCADGEQCTPDGACIAPCASDLTCGRHGLVCDTTSSTCVECVRDADCGGGHHCGADHLCAAGTTDAGERMDAGAPAMRDSGTNPGNDVGVDAARPVDAGPRDAFFCRSSADCPGGCCQPSGVCTSLGSPFACATCADDCSTRGWAFSGCCGGHCIELPANEFANCGTCGFPCDPATADTCLHGVCSCGSGPECVGGQRCMFGSCH